MHNDIPEAQRHQVPAPKRQSSPRLSPLGLVGLLGVAIAAIGAIWFVVSGGAFQVSRSDSSGNSGELTDREARIFGHRPYQEAGFSELRTLRSNPDVRLQAAAARAFEQMVSDASAEGINLVALSGFRTKADQEFLFFEVKKERNQVASQRAEVSAPPGYSEHHTGFAVDIGDGDAPETHVEVEFAETAAFQWLSQYAARYSFELSFPEGNDQGVSYEPWHWRFVGNQDSLETFYKSP